MADIRMVALSGGPLDGQQAAVAENVTVIYQEDENGVMGEYAQQTDTSAPWQWTAGPVQNFAQEKPV